MAEGQKGGEVKPQGRGQHERGAGPGAAAAVERQTTSGPEGKKYRNSCHNQNTLLLGGQFRSTGRGPGIFMSSHACETYLRILQTTLSLC